MGNNESREEPKPPHASKASTPQPPQQRERDHSREHKHNVPSRKPQSHATSRSPAPPTATLVPSPSTASTSTSQAQAHATPSHSPASTHSRQRSITTGGPPSLRPETSQASVRSDVSSMGNSESKHGPPSRSSTLPTPTPTPSSKAASSPSARPVDVPQPSYHEGLSEKAVFESQQDDAVYPFDAPQSNYNRPPRLPLPIEQETFAPGSPIITPQDLSSPLEDREADGTIPRRASVLSATTIDEDDIGDPEAFLVDSNPLAPTVPTTLEWKGDPPERVYVTGTFTNWERKFRMHKDPNRPVYTLTMPLKPGTHHIKFLVGNDMITSNDLPTTVDWTNVLVNYIEVVAPLPSATATQPPAPAEPMPIPGAAITAGQAVGTAEPAARPLDIRTAARAPETEGDLPSTLQETVEMDFQEQKQEEPTPPPQPQVPQPQRQPKPAAKKIPPANYTKDIPDFLRDLDRGETEKDKEAYLRAQRVAHNLPHPPSLPMFLGKSILNGATPHKDDASVLIMPNHTVLNHLATSSIKSGVLATSGTTRYKRKVSSQSLVSNEWR